MAEADSAEKPATKDVSIALLLGLLWIGVSACLIYYNKYLIHPDRFPFPVHLVWWHTFVTSSLTAIVFLFRPHLFPSLTDSEKRIPIDSRLMLTGFMPITACFVVALVLGNCAYYFCSVPFVQLMKEANVVLGYVFATMFSLEVLTWPKMQLVVFILGATSLTLHGEMRFSMLGFVVQGAAQVSDCVRICLTAVCLTNGNKKFDSLSFVLLIMPCCFLCMSPAVLYLSLTYGFPWAVVSEWWPHLMSNALCAFVLNIVTMFFIQHASAMGFILTGILKDMLIVGAGVLFLGDPMSGEQAFGFSLQLLGIFCWFLVKTYPDEFKDGLFIGVKALLKPPERNNSRASLRPRSSSRNDSEVSAMKHESS